MMAMMSRGVAPSVFSARTTASSVVPSSRETRRAVPSRTSTCWLGTTTVSPPRASALGCDTSNFVLIRTERLPWATAAAAMRTLAPTTMVPERSLMTTRAGVSAVTESASSRAISSGSDDLYCVGTATTTVPGSMTFALPSPRSPLMTAATRVAVAKSGSCSDNGSTSVTGIVMPLPCCTSAPLGTRPTVRWLTCTELPPAPPPKPPIDSGPCARA